MSRLALPSRSLLVQLTRRISPSTISQLPKVASFSTTKYLADAQPTQTTKPARPPPGSAPLKVKHKTTFTRQVTPPPSKTVEECMSLYPYLVRRTPSNQIPVYRKWMSGGTRQIILVKKIDGDKKKFMQDLAQAVGAEKDEIRINPTTLQVEIKVSLQASITSRTSCC